MKKLLLALLAVSAFGQTTTKVDYPTQLKRLPALPISATNPMYAGCHFRDDDEVHMRLSYSVNSGTNFTEVNSAGSVSYGSPGALRDPSCMYVPNATDPTQAGTFYFLATPASGVGVQFFSSTDLKTFSAPTIINVAAFAPGAVTAWAPEWWKDPNGNYYFWVAVGFVSASYNTPKTPYLVQFNPVTHSIVGTPSIITLTGTTQSNTFDYFPYFTGGLYYIFYVDQQNNPTVTQPIAYATSSSRTGPYVQQTTPGVDYYGLGTFQAEAPTVFPLANTGCVRLLFDTWIFPPWGGRKYSPVYRDSCVSAGTLFTAGSLVNGPLPLNINAYEHGTVMVLTDTLASAVVYNATSNFQADNKTNDRFGINTPIPFYPLEIGTRAAPSGGIQYPEPASLGFNPGPGSCAPGGGSLCGQITVCAAADQQCWLGWPGPSYLFQNYTGIGAFGQFKFINTASSGTAESSIMFGDAITALLPTPTSSQGLKAIWTAGENNQSFIGPDRTHRFSIFNAGINIGGGLFGGHPISLSGTDGTVFIPWGLRLGVGNASAYDTSYYSNIDSWGSTNVSCPNCGFRINMGAGTNFGDRNALVAMGSLNVQNFIAQSGGSNTDLAGFLVIGGGGTITRTFTIGTTGVYSSQPICTGSDATAANPVRVFTSTSGSNYILNVAGTAGDTVNYICIAHSF